jgi:hypothetical protein
MATVLPRSYVYEHPAEAGLGEHWASPDHPPLEERPANSFGAVGAPARGPLPGEVTMADLDMPHGTVVTVATDDDGNEVRDGDRDLEIVEWTDRQGNPRRTSVHPEFFAEHFREVTK